MAFDVFALRDRVVEEYREYFESFVNVLDPEIRSFIRQELATGALWPDAVLQLNPAYQPDRTLGELADQGVITRETARFFGQRLRLHRHQREALDVAQRGEPYVVTTGTGSGKSLTYLLPIFDHVFRHDPARVSVRAIIVYPMNALINSQLESLEEYRRTNWPGCPIRFGRFTGQEGHEEREALRANPPHILLTNYVMLEYLLIRPRERSLLEQATRDLRFLAVDELHVYRGRQGADVAMLLRRVRQRAGNRGVQCIGTSATVASQGTREERRARVAEVATTLFGVPVPASNVIDETLQRVTAVPAPRTPEELRAAVQLPPPEPTLEAVTAHPLAAWVEETFGLDVEEGRLVRRAPVAFAEGLRRLVEGSGLDEALCRERLKAVLDAGNRAVTHTGDPVFAFRLHQFLASGGSVFATLEPPGQRSLTTDGQYATAEAGARRLLFPLAFCRDCGQEYHLVSRVTGEKAERLEPRSPLLFGHEEEPEGTAGYFAVERDSLWSEDEPLPDSWYEPRKHGLRLKKNYERHVPLRRWALPDGTLRDEPVEGAVEGWFQPSPLLLCLRCRAVYTAQERNDFRKLATLSQTGRSTATTLLACAAVAEMRNAGGMEPGAQKVLSFTDNRQDASLQAGHLNDFVQVVLLRGALVRALERHGSLTFDVVGHATFEALDLTPEQFMREPVAAGPGYEQARRTMIELLEYRAFEDLRRAWRVAQPNLEQCGLLRIDYLGLAELAGDDQLWSGVPAMEEAAPERREAVLRAVLDHLRGSLAIDADCLAEDRTRQLSKRASQWLRDPWAMDEQEQLRGSTLALLPGVEADRRDEGRSLSLGARSAVGRYLRDRRTWDLPVRLTEREVERLVVALVERLRGHVLTVVRRGGRDYGVQIMAGALTWRPGDGRVPGPDPVRARALYLRRDAVICDEPNRYFERLYRERARHLLGMVGREHTGQVPAEARQEREQGFREGRLPVLFCSPTMELGVDIRDLVVVHLRNVPPTPANYAQRSGRAGRGGRPALVLTFCSQGNAHDQYYFRRKERMIAGAVAPARMDLANPELVRAHLHSVWLAHVGLDLGGTLDQVLDLSSPGYPLRPDVASQLSLSKERQADVIAAFKEVIGADPSVITAQWYTPDWLEEAVRGVPEALDRAMDRWRELYRAATEQRDAARRRIDAPRTTRREQEEARQREREALREIDLLLNRGNVTESDFYPYRYVATEGFLPGYNFPRLPLRALVPGSDAAEAIDRPRFLGLTEFGPWNVIYHEGRKHRVISCILPASGLDSVLTRARLCRACGYLHPGEDALVDLCEHCGEAMDADSSILSDTFLAQHTVRASRWARISSDEEERVREGYEVTLHYRFAPTVPVLRAEVTGSDGVPLLEVTYAPRADLWRVNHGWRRASTPRGFTIDAETGRWYRQHRNGDEEPDPAAAAPRSGIRPYVRDNRNVLLLRPVGEGADDVALLSSLAFALDRGLQVVYQVEEQEVGIEVVGKGRHARLLFWEAAEGGTGVWERLVGDPKGFALVAAEALRICHFDPATGQEDAAWAERCTVACYDCLLSYANQLHHRNLDRYLVRDLLMAVASSRLFQRRDGRDYDEQYRWLLARTDPASSLERAFLEHLYQRGLRLPDHAQHRPDPEVPVQPDFYYERPDLPGVCVFLDGPVHDGPERAARDRNVREALRDRGYRVVEVRYDRPLAEQVQDHPDVFGRA